jgi:hypothetical protein
MMSRKAFRESMAEQYPDDPDAFDNNDTTELEDRLDALDDRVAQIQRTIDGRAALERLARDRAAGRFPEPSVSRTINLEVRTE